GRSGPAPSPRAARGRPTSAQRLPPADSTLRTPASSAIGANGSERVLPLSPSVGVGSGAFVHEPAPTRPPPSRTNASSALASLRAADAGDRIDAVAAGPSNSGSPPHALRRQDAGPTKAAGAGVLPPGGAPAVGDLVMRAGEHVELRERDQPPRLPARQRVAEGNDTRTAQSNEPCSKAQAKSAGRVACCLRLVRLTFECCGIDPDRAAGPLGVVEQRRAAAAPGS